MTKIHSSMIWKNSAGTAVALAVLLMSTGCPVATVDPCANVTCDAGDTCVDGVCVTPDPCDGVTCGDNETCDNGQCVAVDPCDGVTCGDGETCVEGDCIPDQQPAKTYVGTTTCLTCHADKSAFLNSGHSYKLSEVVNGQMPEYPFTDLTGVLERVTDDDAALDDGTEDPNVGGTDNTLGTPTGWDVVSFVIGGFGWKARFIDANGYIVTGSDVQYNFETDGLVSYHNNETDKSYTCGNCHTTGWKAYTSEAGDDRNLNRQNDLPGMGGTFAYPGVQCEACHGAGSAHAAAPSASNITREASQRTTEQFLADDMAFGAPAACDDCHSRHTEKDYPTYVGGIGLIQASGGLIKHREQTDEMQGINPDDVASGPTGPHAGLKCISCHNPHTTTKYQDQSNDPPGMDTACSSCHNATGIGAKDYTLSGGMKDLSCTDCHMPLLAKSAVKHAAVGSGPITGDLQVHIFRIDLTKDAQFTADGKFAYPWITGDWACKTCHNGDDEFDLTFPSSSTIH